MIVGRTRQHVLNTFDSKNASPERRGLHEQIARQLVDLEILYLLSLGARSGYELRKQLSSHFGIRISYGTLYPHLHALEKENYVSGTWSLKVESTPLKKRVYALTSIGGAAMRESLSALGSIVLTMQFVTNKIDLSPVPARFTESREAVSKSIEIILSKHGFSLAPLSVVRGVSGIDHPLECLWVKNDDSRSKDSEKRVMTKIVDSENPLDIDKVLMTHVLAKDIDAHVVILSVPTLRKDIFELSNFYHLNVLEGATWEVVLSDLDLRIDQLSE